MSLPNSSNEGPLFRKPRADLYTALLFIALVAMILACVVAYLEVKDYGDAPYQGGPSVYVVPRESAPVVAWPVRRDNDQCRMTNVETNPNSEAPMAV